MFTRLEFLLTTPLATIRMLLALVATVWFQDTVVTVPEDFVAELTASKAMGIVLVHLNIGD